MILPERRDIDAVCKAIRLMSTEDDRVLISRFRDCITITLTPDHPGGNGREGEVRIVWQGDDKPLEILT
jgi:hypothetical protein